MEVRLPMTRHKYLELYNYERHAPYDYATKGLLNKILPKRITSTRNLSTLGVLRYVEFTLTWLMKYVDELKNFKNPHFKKY